MKQHYKVHEGDSGRRIDVALAERFGHSRSYWQKQIKAGRVTLASRPAKPGTVLEAGQVVEAEAPDISVEAPQLPVVYEDAHIIVIDKPAGLLVHPTGTSIEGTVSHFAAEHSSDTDSERPGIVHRLDRETSGLLVLAKDAKTKAYLQRLFKSHQVKKTYLALLEGRLKNTEAVIDLPVGRSLKNPSRRAVTPLGRKAVTRYRVLKEWPEYTLVEVGLETGRMHQIRVHFAHLGHPVAGDSLYGRGKNQLGLKRQFLHAAKLEFNSPEGRLLNMEAPVPEDLANVLSDLDGRYNQ